MVALRHHWVKVTHCDGKLNTILLTYVEKVSKKKAVMGRY
jgi:hypothetical protein